MKSRTTLWIAGITVTLATAQAAHAQTRMTGSWDANEAPRTRHGEFTCFGAPTCTGSATITLTNSTCSNNRFVFSVDLTLTGVDLSPLACELARERCTAEIVEGSVETLPFADERFDGLVSADVLYHVGEDRRDWTSETSASDILPAGKSLVVAVAMGCIAANGLRIRPCIMSLRP